MNGLYNNIEKILREDPAVFSEYTITHSKDERGDFYTCQSHIPLNYSIYYSMQKFSFIKHTIKVYEFLNYREENCQYHAYFKLNNEQYVLTISSNRDIEPLFGPGRFGDEHIQRFRVSKELAREMDKDAFKNINIFQGLIAKQEKIYKTAIEEKAAIPPINHEDPGLKFQRLHSEKISNRSIEEQVNIELPSDKGLAFTRQTNKQIHDLLKRNGVFNNSAQLQKESFRNAIEQNRGNYRSYAKTLLTKLS